MEFGRLHNVLIARFLLSARQDNNTTITSKGEETVHPGSC